MSFIRNNIGNIILLIASSIITLAFVEGGARYYYYSESMNRKKNAPAADSAPTFSARGTPAFWVFNRVYGWDYRPGGFRAANFLDGKFNGCTENSDFTDYGNVGKKTADFKSKDLRIFFTGSSYSMGTDNGGYIHDYIAKHIEDKTGKTVAIENFARDSWGVIQMFEQVLDQYEKIRPDLVIVSFNTGDVTRDRTWRHVIPAKDGFYNFFQTITPELGDLRPSRAVLHPTVISDEITEEWCERMNSLLQEKPDQARDDPVVKKLLLRQKSKQYEIAHPETTIDYMTLNTSFSYNALVNGNPFYDLFRDSSGNILGTLGLESFEDDERFVEVVKLIKAKKIPMVFVHIPTYEEIKTNEEWLTIEIKPARFYSLIESLQRLTGQSIQSLLPYYKKSGKAPEKLVEKYDKPGLNWHPNHKGLRIAAKGIADIAVGRLGGTTEVGNEPQAPVYADTRLDPRTFSLANVNLNAEGKHPTFGNVFRITADGEPTEHYLNSGMIESRPGPHTFSVWVKAENNAHLRLQLLDTETDGVVADFDIASRQYKIFSRNSIAFARITEGKNGWVRVAVTANLARDTVYGILQMKTNASAGSVIFTPSGQTLRFAGPRLGYGYALPISSSNTNLQ